MKLKETSHSIWQRFKQQCVEMTWMQVQLENDNYTEAENMFDKTITLYDALGQHSKLAEALAKLGVVYQKKVNSIYAGTVMKEHNVNHCVEGLFKRAIQMYEDLGMKGSKELNSVLQSYAQLLTD